MNTMDEGVFRRFVEKAGLPDPETGCMEWTAAKFTFGYGALKVGGRTLKAHRLAYGYWVGPIPNGSVVRHRCDNPPCVNPEHLEIGTPADNTRDRDERGRYVLPAHIEEKTHRTHCPLGHELAGSNLLTTPKGRECRACSRARMTLGHLRRNGVETGRSDLAIEAAIQFHALNGGG